MEEREKKRPWVFLLAEGHPAERWLQAQLDPLLWLDSLTHTHLGCLPSGPDLRQLLTHTWLKANSPPTSCFTHTDTHKHTSQPESFLSDPKQPWSCPPLHHPLALPPLCVMRRRMCVCVWEIWAGWGESEGLQHWGIMGIIGSCVHHCMGRNSIWAHSNAFWQDGHEYLSLRSAAWQYILHEIRNVWNGTDFDISLILW